MIEKNRERLRELPYKMRIAFDRPTRQQSERHGKLRDKARALGISEIETEAAKIRSLAEPHNPQGVLLGTPEPLPLTLTEAQLLYELGQGPRRVLLLDGISDTQNFAAMARNALSLGMDALAYAKDTSWRLTPAAFKISAGALAWLPTCPVQNIRRFCSQIVGGGHPLILSVVDSQATSLYLIEKVDLARGYTLVIGSEEKGLRPAVRKTERGLPVRLPMEGPVTSLNAAHAATAFISQLNRIYWQQQGKN